MRRPFISTALAAAILVYGAPARVKDIVSTVTVDATPGHAINSFDPDSALGSSIDVLSRTGIDKVYTPHIIQEALSAGLGADHLSQQHRAPHGRLALD